MKKKKNRKRSYISTIILITVFLVGLSVMLYPTFSNYINTKHQSYAIAKYDEVINNLTNDEYEKLFLEAEDYNKRLKETGYPLSNYDKVLGYEKILDVSGTGIMGYVTIPQIRIQLPIYHGTSEEILNIAAGHLEGSTLPIGGESTHSVISAHRGLPSAKLFSDLNKLSDGDIFTITVLNEILTYQVNQILIIEPHEIQNLEIVKGEDYITLLTCTPYGINTHRLLIRGTRIETEYSEPVLRVSSDAVQIESLIVCTVIVAILLLILFLYIMIYSFLKSRRDKIKKTIKKRFLNMEEGVENDMQ